MRRDCITFTVFKRSQGTVYYARFKDVNGKRIKEVSTGQTAKVRATSWAASFLDKLVNDQTLKAQVPLFRDYAANFYDYDTSQWIKGKLARGGTYSRTSAQSAFKITAKHLIPHFGKLRLDEINVSQIEGWILNFPQKAGVTPATANRTYTFLRSILKEAYRTGMIKDDPTLRVRQLTAKNKQRGILTPEEVVNLFSPAVWQNDHFTQTAAMLSVSTAIRMGEMQALQRQHVHPDHIDILYSWANLDGLKVPKNGKPRTVAIPVSVYKALQEVMNTSPYKKPDDLVFFGATDGKHPLGAPFFLKRLRQALVRIGIPLEEQKGRVLCWHSFRHFAATYLRNHAPDHEVRMMTGHADTRMLDHYTEHTTQESLLAVRQAQTMIFG